MVPAFVQALMLVVLLPTVPTFAGSPIVQLEQVDCVLRPKAVVSAQTNVGDRLELFLDDAAGREASTVQRPHEPRARRRLRLRRARAPPPRASHPGVGP